MELLKSPFGSREFSIALLFSLLLLSSAAHSQTQFGVKAGLNISDVVMTNFVNPDVEADLRLKPGLHAGLFVKGTVNERVGLAAELLYSNKGVRGNTDIHLRYINVPLLVRYKLSEKIFASIGPELGYLFSASSAHGDVSSTYNNKLDLGIDAGFSLEGSRMSFELRYGAGLLSVREVQGPAAPGVERIKYQNRVLQLSVGYNLWVLE